MARRKILKIILTLVLTGMLSACSKSDTPFELPPDRDGEVVRFSLKDLPASIYLATAADASPPTDYKMLAWRKLEKLAPNPSVGSPGYIPGLRVGAFSIEIPSVGDEISLQKAIGLISKYLNETNYDQIAEMLYAERKTVLGGSRSTTQLMSMGLGPSGLLTSLEAYLAGADVIGVEKRAQYARPQVLRLTPDTIKRIKYFTGAKLWKRLEEEGIVSRSPNWVPNRLDLRNPYITREDTPENTRQRDEYSSKGLEIENVEIIRINHLELLLAALLQKLAERDSNHLRLYYGTEVDFSKVSDSSKDTFEAVLRLHWYKKLDNYYLNPDIVTVSDGASSKISEFLDNHFTILSKKLYGATAAFRLPRGFDIGLRPIENREGTASVLGVAKIDVEKLVSDHPSYQWSMIDEKELCYGLNEILHETAAKTHTLSRDGITLPCDGVVNSRYVSWDKQNGGSSNETFLPRTRYFFTAGIAYLGADISQPQWEMFSKTDTNDPQVHRDATEGLKKFLLVLAKKHMPREYVEGSGLLHPSGKEISEFRSSSALADENRVISIAEERHSLSTFPIEIKKADKFEVKKRNTVQVIRRNFNTSRQEERDIHVVFLGDAYATTHFFTGSGAVNGLRAATIIGGVIRAGANNDGNWRSASQKISELTDLMHQRVMEGHGNSPLDGPFNERLSH